MVRKHYDSPDLSFPAATHVTGKGYTEFMLNLVRVILEEERMYHFPIHIAFALCSLFSNPTILAPQLERSCRMDVECEPKIFSWY